MLRQNAGKPRLLLLSPARRGARQVTKMQSQREALKFLDGLQQPKMTLGRNPENDVHLCGLPHWPDQRMKTLDNASTRACLPRGEGGKHRVLSDISGHCSRNNMQRKLLLCPGFDGSLQKASQRVITSHCHETPMPSFQRQSIQTNNKLFYFI